MTTRSIWAETALAVLLLMLAGPALAQDSAPGDHPHPVRDACRADVERLCPGVEPGGGRIVACIRDHAADLSLGCHDALARMHAEHGNAPPPK